MKRKIQSQLHSTHRRQSYIQLQHFHSQQEHPSLSPKPHSLVRSQHSHISKLKYPMKSHLNTVFSCGLFTDAHKVRIEERETYLSSSKEIAASNEKKIKELYQIYLQRSHKSRYSSIPSHPRKLKRLSLQHSYPLELQQPPSDSRKELPFGSSLTRIILNHCQIQNNQTHQQMQYTHWVNILTEIDNQSTEKIVELKQRKEKRLVQSQNPYELRVRKGVRGRKENDKYGRRASGQN